MGNSLEQQEDIFNLVTTEFDYNQMEELLNKQLEDQLEDLETLVNQHEAISNPDTLGQVVVDTIWKQLMNQVGIAAGEDFINSNGGNSLDLRNSAHIQTTKNFEAGKIASHNTEINYQERYDNMQSKYQKDDQGNTVFHTDRSGKQKQTLVKGSRNAYDMGRPAGSKENGTDMDHTISAAEIMRDSAANAHMTEEERILFANSDKNLNEINSSHNRSKGDLATTEWLDNKNSNGQKPTEIYDIDSETEAQYRKKDQEAREEYERKKQEGEQKSKASGKKSQKEEAFRIGGKVLRTAIMGLLSELIKEIGKQFINWIKSKNKKMKSLLSYIKKAIENFITNLKKYMKNSVKMAITTIVTAIYQPIANILTKVVSILKQAYTSLKEIKEYLKDPQNSNKSLSVLSLEVGKILVVGITAAGTVSLSGAIETGLSSIPGFGFPIPLLGSLASILGIVGGGIVSALLGAILLNSLDKLIAKKLKSENALETANKKNEIIKNQIIGQSIAENKVEAKKNIIFSNISQRHEAADEMMKESLDSVFSPQIEYKNIDLVSEHQDDFDQLQKDLENLL